MSEAGGADGSLIMKGIHYREFTEIETISSMEGKVYITYVELYVGI